MNRSFLYIVLTLLTVQSYDTQASSHLQTNRAYDQRLAGSLALRAQITKKSSRRIASPQTQRHTQSKPRPTSSTTQKYSYLNSRNNDEILTQRQLDLINQAIKEINRECSPIDQNGSQEEINRDFSSMSQNFFQKEIYLEYSPICLHFCQKEPQFAQSYIKKQYPTTRYDQATENDYGNINSPATITARNFPRKKVTFQMSTSLEGTSQLIDPTWPVSRIFSR